MNTTNTEPDARDKFIVDGRLARTIPEAITELGDLLAVAEASRARITHVVAELEAYYGSVSDGFGVAPQHEVDSANTMRSIRQALSDPRLNAKGITSKLHLSGRLIV